MGTAMARPFSRSTAKVIIRDRHAVNPGDERSHKSHPMHLSTFAGQPYGEIERRPGEPESGPGLGSGAEPLRSGGRSPGA
jgi:hypothetical protein